MVKQRYKILLSVLVLSVFVLFLLNSRFNLISRGLKSFEQKTSDVLELAKKDISEPPPLRSDKEVSQAFLTRGGVINWTNSNRQDNNLPALSESQQLDIAAKEKVQDMFKRQYFEHVSPTGGNAGTLLDGLGYKYIAVGENLALGNFANDQALVQAWMDSPGHRANILNTRFKEIGVAVAKGVFEGHTTWLGVQIFALPSSFCPQIDLVLKSKIDNSEANIATLKTEAETKLSELEKIEPKRGDTYNQKVGEYNSLVTQINDLLAVLKNDIALYNQQVQAYNSCIGQK